MMLGTSSSVVTLAKKMTKPETKIITRTVAVPKTKIVKQQTLPQTVPKDTERTDLNLWAHNHRYQINKAIETNAENHSKVHGFQLSITLFDVMTDWHSEAGARC
mgnify:CR=1 FL=1